MGKLTKYNCCYNIRVCTNNEIILWQYSGAVAQWQQRILTHLFKLVKRSSTEGFLPGNFLKTILKFCQE